MVRLGLAAVALSAPPAALAQTCQWLPGDPFLGLGSGQRAAVMWDPDGAGPLEARLVVGGYMTLAQDVPVRNVAAWDGKRWRSFGAGLGGVHPGIPEGWVFAIESFDGALVAGGNFRTDGNGSPTGTVARWNGSSWERLGDNQALEHVRALHAYQGRLYAGGEQFAHFNTGWVAEWDGTHWRPLGLTLKGATQRPVEILTHFNGEVIALGEFRYEILGTQLLGRARWDGAAWQPMVGGVLNTGSVLTPYSTALFGGELLVGAVNPLGAALLAWNGSSWRSFPGLESAYRAYVGVVNGELMAVEWDMGVPGVPSVIQLRRWNGSAWNAVAEPLIYASDYRIVDFGGTVAVTGFIGTSSLLSPGLAFVENGEWRGLGEGFLGTAYALGEFEGDLVMVGDFSRDVPAEHSVARLRGGEWEQLGGGISGTVFDTRTYQGQLIAAGFFSILDKAGVPRHGIACFDGNDWRPLGTGLSGQALPLAEFEGDLVVGGVFTTAGGLPANRIARWDGTAYSAFGAGFNNFVFSLAVQGDDLFAGGDFTQSGTVPVSRIARWDGSAWHPLGAGLSERASTILVDGERLLVGGRFVTAGSVPALHVASWDGTAWAPVGDGFNDNVLDLEFHDGAVWAGGRFTMSGAASASRLARWNGAAWEGVGEGTDNIVYALRSHGGTLHLGGAFRWAGGEVSVTWAAVECGCDADCDGDGKLTLADFGCFQTRFAQGDPYADCNIDGVLNLGDFGCFQTKFALGCP